MEKVHLWEFKKKQNQTLSLFPLKQDHVPPDLQPFSRNGMHALLAKSALEGSV